MNRRNLVGFVLCTATVLVATAASAQIVSVLDLNVEGMPFRPVTHLEADQPTLDGRLFFRAESDDGDELWWTDGTTLGTVAENLAPGGSSSIPDHFALAGGRLYFTAIVPGLGRELWVTDGPEQASLVADLETGVGDSVPLGLTAFDDDLYFVATVGGIRTLHTLSTAFGLNPLGVGTVEPSAGTPIVDDDSRIHFLGTALPGGDEEIWASGGAVGVTEAVTALACPEWGELLGVSTFVFAVCDLGGISELYRLDPGPASGVTLVHRFGDVSVEQLTAAGGNLYMVVAGAEIWAFDGGTGMTRQVTSFGSSASPEQLLRYQGDLLFTATVSGSGRELYWTDGSTVTQIEIREGFTGSDPQELRLHDGLVYFLADDGEHGEELWITDGTEAGTEMVVDLEPGVDGSDIDLGPSTPFGLAFRRGIRGLWITDGTEPGTEEIEFPDSFATSPRSLWADPASGPVFFHRDLGAAAGGEPAVTDGTVAGTADLGDVAPGEESSYPTFLATLPNGRTLFSADDRTNGRQLWSTWGMGDDAELVRVIDPNGGFPLSGVVFGDFFYFCAEDGVHGHELWRSDGTADGTELFADLHPAGGSSPCDQAIFGSHLYFGAKDDTGGGLWKTDATPQGTELVKWLGPDRPFDLTVFGAHLYFTVWDDTVGDELWRSDGTSVGTALFLDLVPGAESSSPGDFTIAGGLLYFTVDDGALGEELWRTDGTVAGTHRVVDPDPAGSSFVRIFGEVGGGLLFEAQGQLFFTDGAPGSATLLLAPDSLSISSSDRARFGDHLYFVAGDQTSGSRDLWRTDGTVAGTQNLQLEPGAAGSFPSSFAATPERLYLKAWDADAKSEIHILEFPVFADGFESGSTSVWSSVR